MIRFSPSQPSLESYENVFWENIEEHLVEFFPKKPVSLKVVDSNDPNLGNILEFLVDGQPMSIDLEWKPDRLADFHPISLFQFASSKGIIIVTNSSPCGTTQLKHFIESHQLFGKGMTYDHFKLLTMFGTTFQIEDIEHSRILPNGLPVNFNSLVEELIGTPAAQFKDKTVSTSDWSRRPLSTKQILYAAFDAHATYLCFHELLKRYGGPLVMETAVVIKRKREKEKTQPIIKASGQRRKPQMMKQFKPKIDFRVKFVDVMKKLYLLKTNEPPIFEPRPAYNPKQSLFNRWKTHQKVVGNFCVECGQEYEDIIEHVWNAHYSELSYVYFPDQTPKYNEMCLQQIQIADERVKLIENSDQVICTTCNRQFPSFHSFYAHCRIQHAITPDMNITSDAKQLLLQHLMTLKQIEDTKCKICDKDFGNELIDHCWSEHGDIIAHFLKHRPVNYNEHTFQDAFDFGVMCLNELASGEMCWGSYSCAFCKIGFDDPGELFIHLFHRHTRVRAVHASKIDAWPLKLCDLLPELKSVLKRTSFINSVECLIENNIYKKEEKISCNECHIQFVNDEQMWKHSCENHLIIIFDPLPWKPKLSRIDEFNLDNNE